MFVKGSLALFLSLTTTAMAVPIAVEIWLVADASAEAVALMVPWETPVNTCCPALNLHTSIRRVHTLVVNQHYVDCVLIQVLESERRSADAIDSKQCRLCTKGSSGAKARESVRASQISQRAMAYQRRSGEHSQLHWHLKLCLCSADTHFAQHKKKLYFGYTHLC